MGLGAAGGAIGSFADNVLQIKREGWGKVIANTALGSVMGAVGNMGGGPGFFVGAGAGFVGSMGSEMIDKGTGGLTWQNALWAAGDGLAGGTENAIESGMSAASPSKSATVGNSWGVGLSGVQGLICGGLDNQKNANC
jgi:hypothetical protein